MIRPKEVTLLSRTQPSGPLCLWQCFYVLGYKGVVAVGQGGDAGASEKYCSWIIEINYLHDHHHDQQNHLHDHHHDYENHLHNRHQHYHDHHGYHHGQGGGAGTSE